MKTSDIIDTHKATDRENAAIRKLMHDELPQAPTDMWFTRKVMNRLPEKKHTHTFSVPEKLCYIAGVLLMAIGWGSALTWTAHHGLTPPALIVATVIPIVAFVCICVFAIPAVKRAL